MKKRFTFLTAALMLLTMINLPEKALATTDVIDNSATSSNLGSTSTSSWVTNFSITGTSGAVYYIHSMGTNGTTNALQFNKNGFLYMTETSTNGDKLKSITVTGTSGKSLYIYAQNSAFSAEPTATSAAVTTMSLNGSAVKYTFNSDYTYLAVHGKDSSTQIISISIEWESAAPSYTITAQSNNTSYGTVSLSGSVITGSPKSGCRYASPAYSVSPANSATVSQDGNAFTVTPSANTTVTINFEAIPTHTATFSVNGATTSENFAEGASIEFPDDPANISGRKFVGWVTTPIAVPTDDEPSFVNTTSTTMSSGDVTFYAVFAIATPGDPVETKTQTLQYDTWTYSGNTTDKTTYRLFHTNSYIESAAFDLSKLTKVIVYGGTFGGDSYNSLTIGDGTNTWKNVTVTGKSETGVNTYTDGTALTGTKALRVTSNSGMASSTGVRISKVEIFTMEPSYTYSGYCTSVEVYTITAVSNNTEYGTVTLSGEVITGSPKSGYRYASPAYTVSPANSANVVQDGNEFTVTPLTNTTVTINFELIPTYTLSYVVSPAGAGTVTLGASSGLLEGATTTATALANAGKKFTSWSISGTGASLSNTTDNPVTVTMGAENATVTANFDDVPTNAITYSVNGVTNTVNVEENTTVDLSAPSSALIPVGYVFKGWRTSTISTPTDTDPNDYVTSATSTADITYYAVMAVDSESNVTTHLTSDEIATNFAATAMSYSDAEKSYTDTDESMTWSARCITNSSRHWIQLKSDNDVYIKAVAPQNITEVKVKISNASNSSGGIDDITKHGAFSGSVNLDKVQNNNAGSCGTAASSAIVNNILTINANGTSNTIYIHVTGAARIWNVDVTYVSINTTNFCTSVSTIDLTEDVTIDGDLNISYELTVPSGKTLTVTGNLINTTAANLIIEDGGQLIVPTGTEVAATFIKSVPENTSKDVAVTGWTLISSPTYNVPNAGNPYENFGDVTNLEDGDGYLLYKYDEENRYWRSSQTTGHTYNTLNVAQGYLYGNSSGKAIEFTGNVNSAASYSIDLSYNEKDSDNLAGFNLIGNPFSHDIYKGVGGAINDSKLADGFYIIENGEAWTAKLGYDTPIKPGQGILVKATEEFKLTINNTTANATADKANHDNIMFKVENSECSDVAYALFDKGYGLNKISHRGDMVPMLYIPQNGENYAIAMMDDNTKTFNLGFEAKTTAKYTLTYKAKGEFNYLHVIDRMTGEDIDMLLEGEYSFVGSPQDDNNRFIVRLGYLPNYDDNGEDTFAYQNGSDIVVSGEGELQIFDVMGRKVASITINGVETVNIPTQGVYIMKLNEKTQKIVVR